MSVKPLIGASLPACLVLPALATCGTPLDAAPDQLAPADGPSLAKACDGRDGWSDPAPPAHVFGNTWYVGTCGITVLLVETEAGLVLLDAGPPDNAPRVLANIRALGFDPHDVRYILPSHEHFDHVGALEQLRGATGAEVVTGPFISQVLATGKADPHDPQAAELEDFEPVAAPRPMRGNATVVLGGVAFTAHATPTHSPGSTSWSWSSCADGGEACPTIAYADSASTISADGYRFTDHPERVSAARRGLEEIAALPCDILLTPHPAASDMFARIADEEPLQQAGACRAYAARAGERLDQRLAREAGKQQD